MSTLNKISISSPFDRFAVLSVLFILSFGLYFVLTHDFANRVAAIIFLSCGCGLGLIYVFKKNGYIEITRDQIRIKPEELMLLTLMRRLFYGKPVSPPTPDQHDIRGTIVRIEIESTPSTWRVSAYIDSDEKKITLYSGLKMSAIAIGRRLSRRTGVPLTPRGCKSIFKYSQ